MRAWWRGRSVRTRLAWSYAATVALILFAFSAGIFVFVRHVLNDELNDRLQSDLELAEESMQATSDGVDLARPRDSREHDEQRQWIEIWDPHLRVRFRTPRAGSAMVNDLESFPGDDYRTESQHSVTGERLRILTGRVRLGNESYAVRVARSEEPLRHELRELFVGMMLALPFAIGLSALVGARMARRALRPVELMAAHARSVSADRLQNRLPVENPHDELGRLAAVFNDTLARLDHSFDQLRRFTADASHELRTPLTALRSVGEVGLAERHDATGYRDIIGSMLEEAERLTRVVESLLVLSRADASAAVLHQENLELSDLARGVVSELCVLAEEKRQIVTVGAASPVVASADRLTVTQALVNLLDNAIKYSPPEASIRVDITANGAAHIDITDGGPGIPDVHRHRIFDRFYRLDQSRTSGNGGAGLGLAIAQWAVRANHGDLTLHRTDASGSTFRISLPLAR